MPLAEIGYFVDYMDRNLRCIYLYLAYMIYKKNHFTSFYILIHINSSTEKPMLIYYHCIYQAHAQKFLCHFT